MTSWWRSWHGAPTDPKWLLIARRAGVAPGIVSAIAWALFDHASQADDRGSIVGFDVETYAAFSGFDEDDVNAVIRELCDKGVIELDGRLAAWERRQPRREDDSGERVTRYRQRTSADGATPEAGCVTNAQPEDVTQCNAVSRDVTPCNAPEQNRTDTEQNRTDAAANAAGADCAAPAPEPAPPSGKKGRRKQKPPAEPDPTMTHWAIVDYRDKYRLTPDMDARQEIIATVSDRALWKETMKGWTLRGGRPLNVAGMLRCYAVGFDDYATTARGNGHGRPRENAALAAVRIRQAEDARSGNYQGDSRGVDGADDGISLFWPERPEQAEGPARVSTDVEAV